MYIGRQYMFFARKENLVKEDERISEAMAVAIYVD